MDLSKVKMVVTDMDGTLLNSNSEVSERFFELFEVHFITSSPDKMRNKNYFSVNKLLKVDTFSSKNQTIETHFFI